MIRGIGGYDGLGLEDPMLLSSRGTFSGRTQPVT